MKTEVIDLRSDTVTLPSEKMKLAMAKAPLGDDVFGEDPTINELEDYTAKLFGMEAALFVPSGTMANQIAIKVHTQPGEDIICDSYSHIYQYEGGGIGLNAGCSTSLINSESGQFKAEDVKRFIYPDDIHKPISRLVSLENTCNKGGGTTWGLADIQQIKQVCVENQLSFHLDGARLFNALVARNQSPEQFGELFDTISICLSKGLGAPVGSVLLGSKAEIHLGRRYRKVFGGGMRQAGSLAAAGLFALKNNVSRLQEDHTKAKEIESELLQLKWVESVIPVHTNIVIFKPKSGFEDSTITEKLKSKGILISSMGKGLLRMVTHLDITESKQRTIIKILRDLF
ncbi:MAG: threonine aldolase family protein [Salibacteraceae bacterium]